MKFSREFRSEDQARTHETALKAAGVRAWRHQKPDGSWQVFWVTLS